MEQLGRRLRALVWVTAISCAAIQTAAADIDPMSDYIPITGNPKKTVALPTSGSGDSLLNLSSNGPGINPPAPSNGLFLKWNRPEKRSTEFDARIFAAFAEGRSYQGFALRGVVNSLAHRFLAFRLTGLDALDGADRRSFGTGSVAAQVLGDDSRIQLIAGGGIAFGDGVPPIRHVCISAQFQISRLPDYWNKLKLKVEDPGDARDATPLQSDAKLTDARKRMTAFVKATQGNLQVSRGIDLLHEDMWISIEATQVFAPAVLGGDGDVYCAKLSQSIIYARSAPWVVEVAYNWSHAVLERDDFSIAARIPLQTRLIGDGTRMESTGSRPFLEFSASTADRFAFGIGQRV